jgi:ABC-2 type transport system permease protein
VLVAIQLAVYPSVRDLPDINELVQNYPEALKALAGITGDVDYTSGPGYLGTELFSIMVPLVLIIFAVSLGTSEIAGEEDRHTLDLLLSHPVPRARLVVEKFAAMAALIAAVSVLLFVLLVGGDAIFSVHVGLANLAAAVLLAAVLAVHFGTVAIMIGCATGNRGLTAGLSGALAMGSYLFESLSPLSDFMHRNRWITPFHYYADSQPLLHGFAYRDLGVLVVATVVLLGVGLALFQRRDLAA